MVNNKVIEFLYDKNEILCIALGGSRSKGNVTAKSDYDYFCIIKDECFESLFSQFTQLLYSIENIKYAVYVFYLEHWGYLFKAIDNSDVFFDIAILPQRRIDEMSIRKTNIIIKDTNNILRNEIEKANDDLFQNSTLERKRFYDYIKLFFWEYYRFMQAFKNMDYWYTIRCVERMKTYYVRCDRIKNQKFPTSRSCPEKNYSSEILTSLYNVDGTLETLGKTGRNLLNAFLMMVQGEPYVKECNFLWNTK